MAEINGDHWTHGYNGEDWVGKTGNGDPWICKTGTKQSPINVPTSGVLDGSGSQIASALRTTWSYPDLWSNGTSVQIINNGHTIQVQWNYAYNGSASIAIPANPTSTTPITAVLAMGATDPADRVTAVPLQFHFHATSEHMLAGKIYPLELHIVHRITDPKLPACAGGCFSVIGVLFEVDNVPDNLLLEPILQNAPTREGTMFNLPPGAIIKLGELLPSDRDYVTYEGSLTTPPCSEGLLWHVLTTPQKISHSQWNRYRQAVGIKECSVNPSPPSPPPPRPPPPAGLSIGVIIGHHHRRMLQSHEEELLPISRTQQDMDQDQQTKRYFRRMALTNSPNPDGFTCQVVAFGQNFRNTQSINGRPVKLALD
ncbi:hypothetical protein HYH02_010426 [Chlamydomonas schloesseri]|uniref:Carbonic anhydrase n=1 Tax=Chlamydomonas schloesseri TaxID=2026947 RepID=A0A835TJU1_9CHLO|nr:hypothetical protein HYH02_010426 [Chlamydomonas schloesseri]|eukprot:KAG2439791.1 hypothetical protein HYH02_010426 [Chlamydomonas schloesseri]